MSNAFHELEMLTIGATIDLFAAHTIACRHDGTTSGELPTDASLVVSTIGFASEQMRGGLVLVATTDLVHQLAPEEGDDEAVSCDILGEFANMLLGRLKNRLLTRGHRILFGTSSNAVVQRISMRHPGGRVAWHRFALQSSGQSLSVRLDAAIEHGFVLENGAPAHESVNFSGKVTLF